MRHWRHILWPTIASCMALVILLALSFWQWTRHGEKTAMLEALGIASSATPLLLDGKTVASLVVTPPNGKIRPGESLPELSRVTITGTFIQARSVPVRATLPTPKNSRGIGGLGFFWMTPLQMENNGPVVFINRGFVPAGADSKAPAIETPQGQQSITGLLRQKETPQTFTPADNAAKGEYFARDPAKLATYVALKNVVGFFIDAERTTVEIGAPPVGIEAREMIARIPNNHLQYAGTWFGFALTLLGVFAFFAQGRLKVAAGSDEKESKHV